MSLADANGYLATAQRTHRTLQVLATAARPLQPVHTARDWIVTMHFYVLVAYLNALAATRERRFADHSQRRSWLMGESDLRTIATDYRMLEEWSRDCRYEGWIPDRLDDTHAAYRAVRDRVVQLLRSAGVGSVPVLPEVNSE